MDAASTFSFYLPALKENHRAAVSEEATIPRGKGEEILIVDDEQSVRDITQRILETFGYKAFVAKSGAEAVELYEKNQDAIKLVLTDWMMPGMDGAETIRALRRINPTVKVVLATGMMDNSGQGPGQIQSLSATLLKPFRAQILLHCIR